MPKFITSIQIEDVNENDYELLAEELKKESFKDEKYAAKSNAYITGKGNFSKEGPITLQEVNEALVRSLSKIGKKYSYFVVKNKQVSSAN